MFQRVKSTSKGIILLIRRDDDDDDDDDDGDDGCASGLIDGCGDDNNVGEEFIEADYLHE